MEDCINHLLCISSTVDNTERKYFLRIEIISLFGLEALMLEESAN